MKQGAVVSTRYSQVNALRTIEDILGTQHINLNTAFQRPMADVFDIRVVGRVDLRRRGVDRAGDHDAGARRAADRGVRFAAGPMIKPKHDAAYWDEVTAGFDFSEADQVPPAQFNRVLWKGLMGSKPYPAAAWPGCAHQARRLTDRHDSPPWRRSMCGRLHGTPRLAQRSVARPSCGLPSGTAPACACAWSPLNANQPHRYDRDRFRQHVVADGGACPDRHSIAATAGQFSGSSVQVTATRFGEPIQEVPGSISVVTGDEMRARGATDLRTALALLGGVSVAPGGDAGPAGAVPGLLGVREVDDLLLLIDGIPAGGAFIPQVEAISLNNVERIEVMRGAAPVYFGTTAFAGTINVIHYAAGQRRPRQPVVRFGSYQSGGVGGATVLSTGARAPIDQRRVERRQLLRSSAPTTGARRAAGGWPRSWAAATFRADVDVLALRQKPEQPGADRRSDRRSSPPCCRWISTRTRPTPSSTPIATSWSSTTTGRCRSAAGGTRPPYTHTQTDSVRGFIDRRRHAAAMDDEDQRRSRVVHSSRRTCKELFIDSNLTTQPDDRGWT